MRLNPWFAAPVLVALSAGLIASYRQDVPTRADWKMATDHIRQHVESGDGVTWGPLWAGEGRLFLHGLPAFTLAEPDAQTLGRYKRVWLMGAFGFTETDIPIAHTRLERHVFGSITLDLIQLTVDRVVADLYADLNKAQVVRKRRGGDTPCSFWDGRGWHCSHRLSADQTRACLAESTAQRLQRFRRRRQPHCGLNPWLNVSRDYRVIDRKPRRCIWFHPQHDSTMQINWTPGKRSEILRFSYGFTDKTVADHIRTKTRTQPAQLVVLADGKTLGARTARAVPGWFDWTVKIPGDTTTLSFEVQSASTVDGHLCVDATLHEAKP